MLQAQDLIYSTQRGTTFRVLLQTSLRYQKQGINGELAKHFHEIHNINDTLNVTILQNKTATARSYHEDKWICKLKTLAPHALNTETVDYVKEMYNFY